MGDVMADVDEMFERNEWVERVLEISFYIPEDRDASDDDRREASGEKLTVSGLNVAFAKLKLQWNSAKSTARSQLAALQRVVASEYDDPDTANSAADIIAIMDRFNEGLADTLDDLYGADDPEQKALLRSQAAATIRRYETYIESDPLIEHIEVNPFVPMSLNELLLPPLQDITAALEQQHFLETA